MVVIDSISRGIVIDHIKAGSGMKVLEYLNIDTGLNTIAFIMNASSKKHGRKDVVKIENMPDIDLTVLGLVDHNATVNIIEDHVVTRKIKLEMPLKVTNVIRCKNPRCITSSENGIPHIFHLVDKSTKEYRCEYCDDIVRVGE
ncbi:aspartate carbamoyltransferase regulatory chain [Clostridia bacterium]|nr:aspartate carbamoyltransferase regulatory chain [Clostridia bacterium]